MTSLSYRSSFSYHNIVSSRVKGWEDNALDVHPSRFIALEK